MLRLRCETVPVPFGAVNWNMCKPCLFSMVAMNDGRIRCPRVWQSQKRKRGVHELEFSLHFIITTHARVVPAKYVVDRMILNEHLEPLVFCTQKFKASMFSTASISLYLIYNFLWCLHPAFSISSFFSFLVLASQYIYCLISYIFCGFRWNTFKQ